MFLAITSVVIAALGYYALQGVLEPPEVRLQKEEESLVARLARARAARERLPESTPERQALFQEIGHLQLLLNEVRRRKAVEAGKAPRR